MSCGFVMVFSQCETLSFWTLCFFCSVMFQFCAKIFVHRPSVMAVSRQKLQQRQEESYSELVRGGRLMYLASARGRREREQMSGLESQLAQRGAESLPHAKHKNARRRSLLWHSGTGGVLAHASE